MLPELIDEFLLQREREKDRVTLTKDGKPKFYPSLVGRCRRQIAYIMQGYEKPEFPPRIIRILDNGTSMHERFERLFAEMGILLAAEVVLNEDSAEDAVSKLCEKYRISGRTDAIVRIDDTIYIIELKSASNNSFTRMKSKNEPKREHYYQIQLYMHLTGVHNGFILVENKDTQELWEYPVIYDEELANQILDDIGMINEHNDKGTLPDRDFPITSFECRYCDFSRICWKPDQESLYA